MLFLQDSKFSQSYTLHEALINSCSKSISGYGAYAFASKSGVNLLFSDKEFESLLERGKYSMIVGVDEITNMACLEEIDKIQNSRKNLEIKAFLHGRNGALYHPKLSFFRNEEGSGQLIVGSGNLTLGGLRRNYEAFGLVNLDNEEMTRLENYWNTWLLESSDCLKSIDNEAVITMAKNNAKRFGKPKHLPLNEPPINENQEDFSIAPPANDGWMFTEESQVLFAEIPKSGNRWKQANFDINTFTDFFGAKPGDNSQRILLRNIQSDGRMSTIEVRQSVSVKSQNYRFELEAASGLKYPNSGKPIAIFIKLTTRMFLYHIFMPGDLSYETVKDYTNSSWTGRSDRMKRVVTTTCEVNKILNQTIFRNFRYE